MSWRRWGPVLAVVALPFLGNWPVLSGWLTNDPIYTQSGLGYDLGAGPLAGYTALDPNVGITTQALGRRAADDWLSGRVPWWDPDDGVGMPLSAEGQNPALLLPYVLLLALRNGPLAIALAFQVTAALSAYALLRYLSLARTAALLGAGAYALNGTFAWFGDAPAMPIAFAPLLLLGVEHARAAAMARKPGGWGVAALAVALSLYAAFPETAWLDGLLAAVWSVARLVTLDRASALRMASRLVLAVLAGLLFAAPELVPIAHLLSVGNAGIHAVDMSVLRTPPAGLALTIMPYAHGPLTEFGIPDPTGRLQSLPNLIGGYIPASLLVLAFAAIGARRAPNRGLRWALAGWSVSMLGASYGVPGFWNVVYAVPMMRAVQVSRYAAPSWELAAAVLAAMALDDWHRGRWGRGPRWRVPGLAGSAALAFAGAALLAGIYAERLLWHGSPGARPWLVCSVLEAAVAIVTVAVLLARSLRRPPVVVALVLIEAAALFSVPRLSGLAHARLDTGPVVFLRAHLGLHRAYALGPLGPNYGAFFGIAMLDSNYLPSPSRWSDYVQKLDPTSDRLSFTGIGALSGQPVPDHAAEFLKREADFQALGVAYVVVPAGSDAMLPHVRVPVGDGPRTARALPPGASLATTIAAADLHPGSFVSIAVTIGTYVGAADGSLRVAACSGARCSAGAAPLAGALDNQALPIPLATPLPVAAGQDLRLTFTHDGGTAPVAVWMYPPAHGQTAKPGISLREAQPDDGLRLVDHGRVADIFAVSGAAPFFQADGCAVSDETRASATTQCVKPSRLIRRELAYEGWRATVNGRPAMLGFAPPLFQSVAVPAGASRVVFSYRPPWYRATMLAFVLGLAATMAGFGWPRRSGSMQVIRGDQQEREKSEVQGAGGQQRRAGDPSRGRQPDGAE